MKKTFEQIESEIRSELTNQPYWGDDETEQFLTDIIGKQVINYDTKYDDGCDDEEDEYVMKACFSTKDNEYNIYIYYGDNTLLIGCVDVIHQPIKEDENKYTYLLVDEYTYDNEEQEILITPCVSKEVAIEELQNRYEWYLKESYLSQFVDENGNVDEDELDEDDSWDITEDSVDIYISSKDTSLSLYIKKEIIKK